jgi:acetyl-CoA/propionyl-CoA carboxylase biotin carboxyl carrier protein
VYAEDPESGFLPTGGRVLRLHEAAGDGIRVDSSLVEGLEVSADYDPMLAKVIAHGPDRASALARLRAALRQTAVVGVTTNIEFLGLLLEDADVAAGRLDTELIARRLDSLAFARPDERLLARAALILFASAWNPTPESPWKARDGWRIGARAASEFRLVVGADAEHVVRISGTPDHALVTVGGGQEFASAVRLGAPSEAIARTTIDGLSVESRFALSLDTLHLVEDGRSWAVRVATGAARTLAETAAVPELRSPMPGAVVAIHVNDGDEVEEGAAIIVVEAMKMEHVLRATSAGRVDLQVTMGSQVNRDQLLATVVPSPAD